VNRAPVFDMARDEIRAWNVYTPNRRADSQGRLALSV